MKVKRTPLQAQVSEQLMALIDAQAKANELTRSKYVAYALAEFIAGGENTPEGHLLDIQFDIAQPDLVYDDAGEVIDVKYSNDTPWNLSGRVTQSEAEKARADLYNYVQQALFQIFSDREREINLETKFVGLVSDAFREVLEEGVKDDLGKNNDQKGGVSNGQQI